MDASKMYCLFYILLLTMTTPALCVKQKVEEEMLSRDVVEDGTKVRERRQVGSLALYAGTAVAPWLFAALVATYGLSLVLSYGIRKLNSDYDNHTCANNRGWCRPSCFPHEKVSWYHSSVCGSYKCCVN